MYKIYPLVDGAIDTDHYYKAEREVDAYEIFTDLVRDVEDRAVVETTVILLEDDNEDDPISDDVYLIAAHTVAR